MTCIPETTLKNNNELLLETSFDDIPLSLIYKPRSISNPYPFANHSLFCGSTMARGLKSLNVGPNMTICGSLDGCDCCISIYGCGNYTSIGAYSCGLPSKHENRINHPLHHIAYVCVTLVMLLLLEVICSFLIWYIAIVPSFVVPILNYDPSMVWMNYV
jgi:hypothetical protein